MSLKTNNLPSNKEEVLEEGFLDGLATLAVRAGARRLGGRAARQAIRSAPTATSLFSGGGFIGSLASFIISTASSIYFGLMRVPGGSVVLAMSSDIYKAYTGYNFRENPYIFDGSAEKAKGLIKNLQIAYKRYLTAYLNEIRSFDPNDGTNLLNTLLALGTGGLSQLVTGGDPVGYLTSVVTETGWGKTVSKKIMERREERANELNDKLIKFNPKNYINSSQYPVEEFKRDLLSDLRSMISTEYIRSSKTGVNQPHGSQEEAIQAITPLLNSLVEANLQLWYGLTNRTENGKTTETTQLAPKKSSAKVSPKRQEAAKAAAAATATAISKRTANNKNALKQKLEQTLPQEEKNNISLWYNWLSSFVDTQAEINMLDDVLEKWFSSERVKKLEERKFVLPGGNSYEDLMDFIEKNTSYSIGDPKKDLVVLDRLLDLISSERKMKKRAKQAARKLKKAKELEDKSSEAEGLGKQKKSDRLKKRAAKEKEKAKMKITESELNRIILQEVNRLLNEAEAPADPFFFRSGSFQGQSFWKSNVIKYYKNFLDMIRNKPDVAFSTKAVGSLPYILFHKTGSTAGGIGTALSSGERGAIALAVYAAAYARGKMNELSSSYKKYHDSRDAISRSMRSDTIRVFPEQNFSMDTAYQTFVRSMLQSFLDGSSTMGKTWNPTTGEPMSKAATPPSSTSKALNTSGLPADWASFVRRGGTQTHLQMAKAWLATMPDKKTYKDFQNWYTQTIAKLKRKALGPQEIIKNVS